MYIVICTSICINVHLFHMNTHSVSQHQIHWFVSTAQTQKFVLFWGRKIIICAWHWSFVCIHLPIALTVLTRMQLFNPCFVFYNYTLHIIYTLCAERNATFHRSNTAYKRTYVCTYIVCKEYYSPCYCWSCAVPMSFHCYHSCSSGRVHAIVAVVLFHCHSTITPVQVEGMKFSSANFIATLYMYNYTDCMCAWK